MTKIDVRIALCNAVHIFFCNNNDEHHIVDLHRLDTAGNGSLWLSFRLPEADTLRFSKLIVVQR